MFIIYVCVCVCLLAIVHLILCMHVYDGLFLSVAYVLFRSAESCKESADAYLKVRPEVNGRKLKVYAYREPAKQIPAC